MKTPTCQHCRHWNRLPDKVYQQTSYQKPVGEPVITVLGECQKLDLSCVDPAEDGLAYDASHCADYGSTATTGPKFGCIHFEPKL